MRGRTTAPSAAVLAAVLSIVAVAPAQANAPTYGPDTEYVALGDSFASGLGSTGAALGGCGQSPNGYPALWADAHGITTFVDATCAGATTDDVLNTQIAALTAHTDVVTITIGGNDAVLGNLLTTCLRGDGPCAQVNQQFDVDLPTYLAKVRTAYSAVRVAAPHADVSVLGYPDILETGPFCYGLFVPDQFQRQQIVASVDRFDDGLAASAAAAGFRWVDVRTAFSGHNVRSLSPWIHSTFDVPPVHPNDAGYRLGYLPALTAVAG